MSLLSHHKYEVIVIGAGVAGACAAYELAQKGADVLVIEKEKLPRYKTCGGGIVHRAVDKLPFNIKAAIENSFNNVEIYDQETGQFFTISREKPLIYMAMRDQLDNYIVSEAVKKGAKLRDELKVLNLENKDEYVELATENSKLRADFVIAADGATGISTKISGLNKNLHKVPAIECEVYLEGNSFEQYKNSTRFDFGFLPHGYAWVFPKKDHLSIGMALFRKTKLNLNAYLKEYIEMLGFKKITNFEKHGHHIPIYPHKIKPVDNRILYAGDAIGLADPITSEGISYAIESGKFAAMAVIEAEKDKIKTKTIYLNKLKPLFNELKYAKILARFVHGSPRVRRFVFRHYGKWLGELLTDVIMGEKKYSGIMKNPLNYFKLLKLSGYASNRNVKMRDLSRIENN